MELALKNVAKPAEKTADNTEFFTLYEGLEMTNKSVHSVLGKFDVKQASGMGTKFDSNIHEVLFQVPAQEGQEPGEIINIVRNGYYIKDRVLRSAQVGVVQV